VNSFLEFVKICDLRHDLSLNVLRLKHSTKLAILCTFFLIFESIISLKFYENYRPACLYTATAAGILFYLLIYSIVQIIRIRKKLIAMADDEHSPDGENNGE
jgi:fucose 4-O-acetylase-like acetyltransferase